MKQLVSILIPAFNAEKWIGACIESALAQTWSKKEIIVVDDGSKDLTLKVAKTYEASNVYVSTQNNRGASAARNHALSLAQGDYIQWLDADDLLASDKIARQMEDAEPGDRTRVLLSGSWGRFYFHPKRTRFLPDSLWQDLTPTEWMFLKLDENLWMAIESWLVSRKLSELTGAWDESLHRDDDGEYFSRAISHSQIIRFVPESRVFCRRGNVGVSSSRSLDDRKLDSQMTSLRLHIQRLRAMEDSGRTRDAGLKLLNRWAHVFYPERMDIYQEMKAMAVELGGDIQLPKPRWKYRWIQKIFGWQAAKNTQRMMSTIRSKARMAQEWLPFPGIF